MVDKIRFQPESVVDLWDEVMPLLREHWQEIATYKDIPLSVNTEVYEGCEKAGLFHAYTIRKNGMLIGYSGYFIRQSIHYSTSKWAVQDVLYLDPDSRGKMVGVKFIKWCDDQLKELGVEVVCQHVKTSHNWGALLGRMGYEHTENIWQRRL